MAVQLPRLPPNFAQMPNRDELLQRYWQTAMESIEETLNAILAIPIIQAAVAAAQADADAAQDTATGAIRELARINSYTTPTDVLTGQDAGANARIVIANHTRVYPVQGAYDVPDLAITGTTLTGLAYTTTYYVYYDDPTLANPTPSFLTTTSAATAQPGAAAGRHFVGVVTTPAAGGGNTSGNGGYPPGGGGGNPIP